jgi:hypothetical protein
MTDLYVEPIDVLRREIAYLKERLRDERDEVKRFKEIEAKRSEGLADLIRRAEDDAEMTASLIVDYRAAIRKVGRS